MDLKKDKIIALNHGDCWNNNMLFRSTTAPKNLPDVLIIDLQVKMHTKCLY